MQTCYRHKGRLLLKALKLNMYPCTWTNRLCFVFYVLPRVQVTSTCFLTFSKGWDPVVQSTQVCNGQFFHQLKTQQTKMYLYLTLRPVTTTVTVYSLNYSYKTVNTMFSVLSFMAGNLWLGFTGGKSSVYYFNRSQVFEHGPISVKIQKQISNLN